MKKKKKVRKAASVRKKSVRKTAKRKVPPAARAPLPKPIGKVTHYFPHVKAGVVKVTNGSLSVGDTIQIKGHTTDFKQTVVSLQLDHEPIRKAKKGEEVGIQVKSRVRQNDLVYKPSGAKQSGTSRKIQFQRGGIRRNR